MTSAGRHAGLPSLQPCQICDTPTITRVCASCWLERRGGAYAPSVAAAYAAFITRDPADDATANRGKSSVEHREAAGPPVVQATETTAPPVADDPPVSLHSTPDEDLVLRWQHHRDAAARDELLQRHFRLIGWYVSRHRRGKLGAVDVEDLEQAGFVAFLEAMARFDPSRGAFVPYACRWLHGAMCGLRRELSGPVRFQKGHQMRIRTIELNALRGMDGDLRYELPCESMDPPDVAVENAETVRTLRRGFADLEVWEQQLLELRFSDDLTYGEIAARLGVTERCAGELAQEAIEKLRAELGARKPEGRKRTPIPPHVMAVVRLIRASGPDISVNDIRRTLGLTKDAAAQRVQKALRLGLIRRVGYAKYDVVRRDGETGETRVE